MVEKERIDWDSREKENFCNAEYIISKSADQNYIIIIEEKEESEL